MKSAAKREADAAAKAPPAVVTTPPSDPSRDTIAVDTTDWPHRPLAQPQGSRGSAFQVVYKQSALDQIHLHGQGTTDVEVCGALIGRGFVDDNGPYLLVEHSIRGTNAASRSTNVTFTAETWNSIQTVMDRDYPDKKMVGWYHTHPGFGIFLSDMDVFICDNFFNLPWQSAFVYDPLGGDEGNFLWRSGRPTREPILIEDDVTPTAGAVPLISVKEAMTGSSMPDRSLLEPFRDERHPADRSVSARSFVDREPQSAVDDRIYELMVRVRLLEKRLKILAIASAFLAAFVLMWVVTVSTDTAGWIARSTQTPTTQPAAGRGSPVVPLQSGTRPR